VVVVVLQDDHAVLHSRDGSHSRADAIISGMAAGSDADLAASCMSAYLTLAGFTG
jgi:hypothetical protein